MFQLFRPRHKNTWNLGEIPGSQVSSPIEMAKQKCQGGRGTTLVFFSPLLGKVYVGKNGRYLVGDVRWEKSGWMSVGGF